MTDRTVALILKLAAGYNFLYLKVSDTKAGREVIIEPTVHGPTVGIGLYF